jgi:hypothetical protein
VPARNMVKLFAQACNIHRGVISLLLHFLCKARTTHCEGSQPCINVMADMKIHLVAESC